MLPGLLHKRAAAPFSKERQRNMYETVSAISTPHGKGGIAVIRITGAEAIGVADRVFFPKNGKKLSEIPSNLSVFGGIRKEDAEIDTGVAVVFRAPKSFTGEDTVEISCHGGILLAESVLESTFLAGALPAGPGEFTKRAFLNGKLSLSQAEAVMELIEAESEEKILLSAKKTKGSLTKKLDALIGELKYLLASTYAFIDYPDEDLTDVTPEEMEKRIGDLEEKLKTLVDGYRSGKAISEGIPTVIAGKPNSGKSSLMNAILGEDRAIVSDIAGTTRDTIEEKAVVGKVILRLCDTAGIRDSDDPIEAEGVRRAERKLDAAELILAVFDTSRPEDADDERLLSLLADEKAAGKEIIVLFNKSDLPARLSPAFVSRAAALSGTAITVSAGKEEIAPLTGEIEKRYLSGAVGIDTGELVTNARQHASLMQALDAVRSAREALRSGITQDVASLDLELALARLSETDGRAASEAVVNEIFSHFCVGK